MVVVFSDGASGTEFLTTHEMDTDAAHQDTIYLLKINKNTTLTDKNIQDVCLCHRPGYIAFQFQQVVIHSNTVTE